MTSGSNGDGSKVVLTVDKASKGEELNLHSYNIKTGDYKLKDGRVEPLTKLVARGVFPGMFNDKQGQVCLHEAGLSAFEPEDLQRLEGQKVDSAIGDVPGYKWDSIFIKLGYGVEQPVSKLEEKTDSPAKLAYQECVRQVKSIETAINADFFGDTSKVEKSGASALNSDFVLYLADPKHNERSAEIFVQLGFPLEKITQGNSGKACAAYFESRDKQGQAQAQRAAELYNNETVISKGLADRLNGIDALGAAGKIKPTQAAKERKEALDSGVSAFESNVSNFQQALLDAHISSWEQFDEIGRYAKLLKTILEQDLAMTGMAVRPELNKFKEVIKAVRTAYQRELKAQGKNADVEKAGDAIDEQLKVAWDAFKGEGPDIGLDARINTIFKFFVGEADTASTPTNSTAIIPADDVAKGLVYVQPTNPDGQIIQSKWGTLLAGEYWNETNPEEKKVLDSAFERSKEFLRKLEAEKLIPMRAAKLGKSQDEVLNSLHYRIEERTEQTPQGPRTIMLAEREGPAPLQAMTERIKFRIQEAYLLNRIREELIGDKLDQQRKVCDRLVDTISDYTQALNEFYTTVAGDASESTVATGRKYLKEVTNIGIDLKEHLKAVRNRDFHKPMRKPEKKEPEKQEVPPVQRLESRVQ